MLSTLSLAICISVVLLGMAFMQAAYVWQFYWFVLQDEPTEGVDQLNGTSGKQLSPRHLPEQHTDLLDQAGDTKSPILELDEMPRVAVVLCLRGPDPSLIECLTGISVQEYPHIHLQIIVDNIHDPALDVVNEFFSDGAAPGIHVISELPDTCSLKCAALVEAIHSAPAEIEIFAFIDADTVPDQNWIRDLVEPLKDPLVGATTGNRWFDPILPTLGSYVRQSWNAAAIVQMDLYNIAWGGSFAIKRSTLERCGFVEKWKHAFCEDTMLSDVLRKNQLKLVRIPNLIAENTESTTLSGAYQWMVRQLITVRLYHPKWPLIKLHGWGTAVGSVVAPIAVIVFFLMNDGKPFYFTAAAFLFYQLMNLVLLFVIELTNRRAISQRAGFNQQEHQRVNLPLKLLAIVLVQYLHPLSCWKANDTRRISWRGINYRIGRKNAITMQEYVPYREIGPTTNLGEVAEAPSIN